MYLIFMASKGGVGKTTLCRQIARELHRVGKRVQGHDYDPQQHFARFVEVNPAMFRDEPDFTLVDTQGAHTQTNIDIMKGMKNEKALFVVPFRATEDDYTEALRMRDRLGDAGLLDKTIFVLNGIHRENDKDAKHYRELLSPTVNIARSAFVHRKAYAKEPDSKVINEVSRFINEVIL